MELAVHGKQMSVGEALRAHVQDKLEDLSSKYFNHTTYASVTFSRDGHGRQETKAHITIQLGKNIMVTSDACEKDPYIAFDAAAAKAGKQLQKYKTRLRNHHTRIERAPESEFQSAKYYTLAPEQDDGKESETNDAGPAVVAEMATNIQTMSVSEAVMRLDLSGQGGLLFRNASHEGLNMVYKRADGNIGWIDPDNQIRKAGSSKGRAGKAKLKLVPKVKEKARSKTKPKKAKAAPKASKKTAKKKR